jgi:hypothetical protein
MSHRLTLPVALAIVLLGCTDGGSPVAPPNDRPTFRNGGAPGPVLVVNDPQPIASAVCGFSVKETFSGKAKSVELKNGRILSLSPGLFATVENLATHHAETFSVTGAFRITSLENGNTQFVVTGRNLLGFDDTVGQTYVLAIGLFTFTLDPQGNRVGPLTGEGQLVDLCALLS